MRFAKIPLPESFPADEPLEQICLNHDWVIALIGWMERFELPAAWDSDDLEDISRKALMLTEMFVKADEGGCMSCCCKTPTNQRLNANFELEVSYDGGQIWQSGNGEDPRYTSPLFPPLPETEPDLLRCQMANSIVVEIQKQQAADLLRKQQDAAGAEFAEGLIAFLIALGIITGGLTAALAAIGAFLASLFASLTALEFENAFSESVWDTLLCYLYCNMQNDGTFTESDWNNIQNLVKSDLGGIAGDWLHLVISSMGPVGLANAGRKGNPGTRDCDLCDCDLTWCYEWRYDADDHPQGTWQVDNANWTGGINFVSGTGFEGTNGTVTNPQGLVFGYRGIVIKNLFSQTTITRIKLVFDYTKGNVDFGNGGAMGVSDGTNNLIFNTFNQLPTNQLNVVREWLGSTTTDELHLTLHCSRDGVAPFVYGGTEKLKYIRLEGLGQNPFAEEDNCLD